MGKEVIIGFLEKDPEKRMELIDFITTDYATMDSDDFD